MGPAHPWPLKIREKKDRRIQVQREADMPSNVAIETVDGQLVRSLEMWLHCLFRKDFKL